MKPRSRPTQKKSAYFKHPDFSAAKIGKKSAQITQANKVYICLCVCVCVIIFSPYLLCLIKIFYIFKSERNCDCVSWINNKNSIKIWIQTSPH